MELAPIVGEVFGECFLCLDYWQDPEHPGVCILDKENSGEYDPTTYPVANSFTEFLGMLHITEGRCCGSGTICAKSWRTPCDRSAHRRRGPAAGAGGARGAQGRTGPTKAPLEMALAEMSGEQDFKKITCKRYL